MIAFKIILLKSSYHTFTCSCVTNQHTALLLISCVFRVIRNKKKCTRLWISSLHISQFLRLSETHIKDNLCLLLGHTSPMYLGDQGNISKAMTICILTQHTRSVLRRSRTYFSLYASTHTTYAHISWVFKQQETNSRDYPFPLTAFSHISLVFKQSGRNSSKLRTNYRVSIFLYYFGTYHLHFKMVRNKFQWLRVFTYCLITHLPSLKKIREIM